MLSVSPKKKNGQLTRLFVYCFSSPNWLSFPLLLARDWQLWNWKILYDIQLTFLCDKTFFRLNFFSLSHSDSEKTSTSDIGANESRKIFGKFPLFPDTRQDSLSTFPPLSLSFPKRTCVEPNCYVDRNRARQQDVRCESARVRVLGKFSESSNKTVFHIWQFSVKILNFPLFGSSASSYHELKNLKSAQDSRVVLCTLKYMFHTLVGNTEQRRENAWRSISKHTIQLKHTAYSANNNNKLNSALVLLFLFFFPPQNRTRLLVKCARIQLWQQDWRSFFGRRRGLTLFVTAREIYIIFLSYRRKLRHLLVAFSVFYRISAKLNIEKESLPRNI